MANKHACEDLKWSMRDFMKRVRYGCYDLSIAILSISCVASVIFLGIYFG